MSISIIELTLGKYKLLHYGISYLVAADGKK